MPPSNAVIPLSQEELSKLEDCTHAMSNFVTALLYQVELLPEHLPALAFDRLMIVVGLVSKTNTSLQKLMRQLGQIRDSASSPVKKRGKETHEQSCSKTQGR
jgi:hypothetical protein